MIWYILDALQLSVVFLNETYVAVDFLCRTCRVLSSVCPRVPPSFTWLMNSWLQNCPNVGFALFLGACRRCSSNTPAQPSASWEWFWLRLMAAHAGCGELCLWITAHIRLPNRSANPTLNHLRVCVRLAQERLRALVLDVSKAHRRILIRPSDQGLFCIVVIPCVKVSH